jgi:hypothetical protein
MLKKLVAAAKAQGLAAEHQMQITGKTGKVTTKKIAVLDLTEQGQAMLQRAGWSMLFTSKTQNKC